MIFLDKVINPRAFMLSSSSFCNYDYDFWFFLLGALLFFFCALTKDLTNPNLAVKLFLKSNPKI